MLLGSRLIFQHVKISIPDRAGTGSLLQLDFSCMFSVCYLALCFGLAAGLVSVAVAQGSRAEGFWVPVSSMKQVAACSSVLCSVLAVVHRFCFLDFARVLVGGSFVPTGFKAYFSQFLIVLLWWIFGLHTKGIR
jgi:hypothetical protein